MSCEICRLPGQMTCFCTGAILCSTCIGLHIIQDPKTKHKPIPLKQAHLTQLMCKSYTKLNQSQQKILADTQNKWEFSSAISQKLSKQIKQVKDFQKLATNFAVQLISQSQKELQKAIQELISQIKQACQKTIIQLQEALQAYEKGDSQFNQLADFLQNFRSLEQLQRIKLLQKKMDFKEINLKQIVKNTYVFDIKLQTKYQKHSRIHIRQTSLDQQTLEKEILSTQTRSPQRPKSLITNRLSQTSRSSFNGKSPTLKLNYKRSSTDSGQSLFLAKNDPFRFLYWFIPGSPSLCMYNIYTQQRIQQDLYKRSIAKPGSAWTLTSQGNLFISGGVFGIAQSSAWSFDIKNSKLSLMPSMRISRYNHSSISAGQWVYVIGGSQRNPLKECEMFSIEKKVWQNMGNLRVSRCKPGVSYYKRRIFVGGGTGLDSIEIYNIRNSKFVLLKLKLPSPDPLLFIQNGNQILVLQNERLSRIDLKAMSCEYVKQVENDCWWVQGNVCTEKSEAYFVKNGKVYNLNFSNNNLLEVAKLN